MYITIPKIFTTLERPPVKFDHDKHTKALNADSCRQCHNESDDGAVLFSFPKNRDESSATALMNAYHDECITCHTNRARKGLDTGPVTCGECHVIEKPQFDHAYVAVQPDYYEALRDTYHRDCLACHQEAGHEVKHAKPLDWKSFYVAHNQKTTGYWPTILFDYHLHHQHEEKLGDDCGLCHYMSPERQKSIEAEGRMPSGKDWLLDVDEEHDLSNKSAAHALCINCHLQHQDEEDDAGPIHCGECHRGVERTAAEMATLPRPDCGQDERMLIQIEKGSHAKAVAFNHQSHEANSRSCQDCHHKTLRPCQDCHGVVPSDDGGGVTLAEAYHDVSSKWSCVGCHEAEKKKPNCAGCHHLMPGGIVQAACSGCHTGTLDSLDLARPLPAPEELISNDAEDEIVIGKLENEYGPSSLPHLAIAKNLTDISNESSLATHFHTDETTICQSCHHLGPVEVQTDIPPCSTCHTVRNEPTGTTPTLLGAYHQGCMGCHKQMDPTGAVLTQACTGCHDAKTPLEETTAAGPRE